MASTYSIFPSLSILNEGQILQTMVHTSGMVHGTVLYWAIGGTGINASDFSAGALLGQASVSTDSSGMGMVSFSHTLANDLTTEGVETLQIRLFRDAARTQQLGTTATVTINDTSLTPPPPPPAGPATFLIKPAVAAINEGQTLLTTVSTTNVAAGTVLYWALWGPTFNTKDVSSGKVTGSGTVSADGKFSFSTTIAADQLTEGAEVLQIRLYKDAALTQMVGQKAEVLVNDTSTTPVAPPTPAPAGPPTYMIMPAVAAINEGQTLLTTVSTTNLAAGTVLYWALWGPTFNAKDVSTAKVIGSGTVGADGKFSFSTPIAADQLTEGAEVLQIRLYTDAGLTQMVGKMAQVTVNDTSTAAPPTYMIMPAVAAINEGQTLLTTVSTTNVAAGTVLYWALWGPTFNAKDVSTAKVIGSGTVGPDGKFSFSTPIAADQLTEGAEVLQIRLYKDAGLTQMVGSMAQVTVHDTSTTPPPPTFTLIPSMSSINEGAVLNTMVHTTNLSAGTVLHWALSGNGITASDFSSGSLSGSVVVTPDGMASFAHTLANDVTVEGAESLQLKLYRDAARTIQVGSTASVTINDTSNTVVPVVPTYTITPSLTSINEGAVLTTVVRGSNVSLGTSLFWSLSGTGITSADFSSGPMLGVATLNGNGQFTLSHTLANDLSTEGVESLKINLFSDAALTNLLASSTVSIADTSRSAAPPTYTLSTSTSLVNEGDTLITTLRTTNVADGTVLFYQIRGANIDPQDFAVGAIMGQVVVRNGSASFSHVLGKDLKSEGEETLLIRLFTDKPGGLVVGNGAQVRVVDTSLSLPVATEIYQPKHTPFAIRKWASPVPVPTLKRPDYVGNRPDIWGTNFAPQPFPGGQPALYPDVDPNQTYYGGIAPEYFNPVIAGTNTPYYNNGQLTAWYSQREGARFQVVVDAVDQVLSTEIFGYDSTTPGPTFKTRLGQPVVVRHWNDLPQAAGMPAALPQRLSVHLHGGHNPAHTDGYPSYVINPGMYRDYYYANTVPMGNDGLPDFGEAPSTMFYHDHAEDVTDLHIIKGLSGFWLSFDDRELELVKNHILPGWWKSAAEWNVQEFMENNSPYDIPLALTDRRFNADGSFFFDGFPIGNVTDGYLGDVMMVNGKSYPYLAVEQTQVRMRILGASTGRIWQLSIQDENGVKLPHLRIGNDTWLMPHPIEMSEFTLSPAQRADLVMDFSGYAPGTTLYLVNTSEQTNGNGPQGKLDTIGTTGFSERVMKIVVGPRTAATPTHTIDTNSLLREHTPILASEISNRRTFEFGRSNGLWLINQVHFDSQISLVPLPIGVAEEWTLVNGSGGWWHPIHMHLESHQLKMIEGRAPSPTYFPEKQFNSDTTLLGPNTTAVVYMKFRTFTGPFVMHCHTLAHEDSMMMYNFDPYIDGAAYQAGQPIPQDRNHTVYPYYLAHYGTIITGPPTEGDPHGGHVQAGTNPAPPDVSPLILSMFPFSSWGTNEADHMLASTQDTYLNGRDGADKLMGDMGNDMLVGGHGTDILSGGAGDDLIAGEYGNDTLLGGAGRDGFYFVTADPNSVDVITDFEAGKDFISVRHAMINTNGSAAPELTFVGTGLFSGVVGQTRFADNLLQVDLDGNKVSDINVRLLGISSFDPTWLTVPNLPNTRPTLL